MLFILFNKLVTINKKGCFNMFKGAERSLKMKVGRLDFEHPKRK